ncbi:MAG TPA: acyclic terpene utilization AtuA family protein [Zeimonas sp.]
MPAKGEVRVGCGAGFSGDRLDAALPVVRTLAGCGAPAAIMFETLGERTLALAQLARQEDPDRGYEPLLERMLEPVLEPCLAQRIPILGNFGAANPRAAALAIVALARRLGCRSPRIAIVTGDDLVAADLLDALEYESGAERPAGRILSANAYLGARPLVDALERGADVVVTGRVADPALALAPFAHFLGWSLDDLPLVAAGTLAGHLLECGAQVSGGYYADPGFKDVPDPHRIGFPIVTMQANGAFEVGKADDTGGLVSRHTVAEQILYEIHDPARYLTPDVVLDVTAVEVDQCGPDRVRVRGARGYERPPTLKVTVGHDAGWLGEGEISYAGPNAVARARLAIDVVRRRLGSGPRMRADLVGVASVFNDDDGVWLERQARDASPQDVRVRIAVAADSRAEAARAAEEVLALYTCGPAGGGGVRSAVRRRISTSSAYVARDRVAPATEFLE